MPDACSRIDFHYGCRNGFDGAPFASQGGTHTVLPGVYRGGLEAPAPWTAGTPAALEFRGLPGELVVLALSIDPGFEPLAALSGVLLVGGSINVSAVGIVPAGNVLILPVTHPGVLRRGQGVVVHVQSAYLTSGANAALGPFSVAVLTGT